MDSVNKIINSIYFYCSRLSRQNSLPSLNERKVSAPPPSTSHSGSTLGGGGNGNGGGLRRSTVVARSPSSAKEVILSWVQERTNTYPVIPTLIYFKCMRQTLGHNFKKKISFDRKTGFIFKVLEIQNSESWKR